MDKKGIMTSFLITVILALVIFIPTCYGISKLFRLSDQAKESFDNFAETVDGLPASERKKVSTILVVDKDTFVAAYNPNQNIQLCNSQNQCGQSLYPSAECKGKSCVCLCREFEGTGLKAEGEDITCASRVCKVTEKVQFADGLMLSNFYLEKKDPLPPPAVANGYFRQGFIIARGELAFSALRFPFETVRRQFFFLTAQGNTVFICKDEEGCKIRS